MKVGSALRTYAIASRGEELVGAARSSVLARRQDQALATRAPLLPSSFLCCSALRANWTRTFRSIGPAEGPPAQSAGVRRRDRPIPESLCCNATWRPHTPPTVHRIEGHMGLMTKKARHSAAPGVLASIAALGALALANHLIARRTERRHPPEGSFLAVDGVQLHYTDRGEGSPVVLIHGNAVDGTDWDTSGVAELLVQKHRVITFDRPGFGHSE